MLEKKGLLRGYRILLLKRYFDTGFGLTQYVKYLIAFFGLATQDIKTTLIIAFVYALFCFILGFLYYHYRFVETDNEISNKYNPIMREIRTSINKETFK